MRSVLLCAGGNVHGGECPTEAQHDCLCGEGAEPRFFAMLHRVTNAGLLPPTARSMSEEIVLGPKLPPDAVHVWREWLDVTGHKNIKVRRSDAPYR